MITKRQRSNAEQIVKLADTFGHLYLNDFRQTPEKVLNLSIPCARLIVAGIVTGVDNLNDSVNDAAVDEVREQCRLAVEYATSQHGEGWWTNEARELLSQSR